MFKKNLSKILVGIFTLMTIWSFNGTTTSNVSAQMALSGNAPYINTWLVSGPFDTALTDFQMTSKVGQDISGKKWEYFDDRIWNRSYDDYQDLYGYFTVKKGIDTKNKYVYANTYVYSPSAQSVEFRFAASGSNRLIVNGVALTSPSTVVEPQKDQQKQTVNLNQGWNSILIEIYHSYTDDVVEGKLIDGIMNLPDKHGEYLGFYGRLTDTNGNEVPNIQYSVTGENTSLTIDTQTLSAEDVVSSDVMGRGLPTNILPKGYVEWPYVWNTTLYSTEQYRVQGSHYQFQASGGQPGYSWSIVSGELPDGLTLNTDGTIDGFCSTMGTYNFTIQVKDSLLNTAQKELSIIVKDRPNRWFEEGRVSALSHCIPIYDWYVDPNFSFDLWAERAKRQGHSLVSIETLQQHPYWPSKFDNPAGINGANQYLPRDAQGKVLDGLMEAKEAIERHGMKFGLYYGTTYNDVFFHDIQDLVLRYEPKYLYYDGPQSRTANNFDILYSVVRNYSDEIIINSNVWSGEYGDADLRTTEASHIYSGSRGTLHKKRTIVEPWKSIITKNNPNPYYNKRDDFRQVAKEMIMNAASGKVDNNDQMPIMSRGPQWDSPEDVATRYPKSAQEFIDVREGLIGWFAPVGKPERHESTTGTMPYFLDGWGYTDDGKGNIDKFETGQGPDWGFAVSRDNNIYLHFIEGPYGKKGYQGQSSVTISPVNDTVTKVSWLNEDTPLSFTQNGNSLTIDLSGITADPISTILKIVTDNPNRKYKLTNIIPTGKQLTSSMLKINVEGYMTYTALKVPFGIGDVTYSSSNTSVATVDSNGVVTAAGQGQATITVQGTYENITVQNTIDVIVNSSNVIRVDDTLIGAVLWAGDRETYGKFSSLEDIPFTIEGRSQKGGPINLDSATITMKSGIVNLDGGTHMQPVSITESPVFTFSNGKMTPNVVDEETRVAVWAEINLDGQQVTTNRVFIDLVPSVNLINEQTTITASNSSGNYTPDKVNDGILIASDGTDSSKWSTSGTGSSWIAFDLQEPKDISTIEINFNTLEQLYINTPQSMEIQTSADGMTWSTVSTVTPPSSGSTAYFGFSNRFSILPTKTQYVRLLFPQGSANGVSVDLLEVKINAGPVNIGFNRTVTSSSTITNPEGGAGIVDGVVDTAAFTNLQDTGAQWVQIDLGQSADVHKLKLWHYYADGRTYNDVIMQLSNDAAFSTGVTTVFNNDTNNSVGQGTGSDSAYAESASGKTVSFTPVNARYIRFWSNGSNVNGYNHYVEAEVYGSLSDTPSTQTNLALGKTATASSTYSSSYTADMAVDGSLTTRWAQQGGDYSECWLKVDLGENYSLSSVKTSFFVANDNHKYKYKIEYSTDDTNWNMYADNTSAYTTQSTVEDTNSVTGRYVKITITDSSTLGSSIGEFEVYGE